ncbi:MAG: phosphoglucosamine mutase [Candidatus Krumholzibacteriia bacterium]
MSVSGVRGVIGDGLDAVAAARWAAAYGAWCPAGPVVVGRDSRPTGPMIRPAACAALDSTGHAVVDIGIATTPTTEMAVQGTDAVGGIIITASHNPVEWNALKFLDGHGHFLDAAANDRVRELYDAEAGHVAWDRVGAVSYAEDADERHLAAILALPWLDRDLIARRGLHVVVDAVEGAGGRIVPALLERLGVRCTALGCGRTGRFPHDPEPTPAHLEELTRTVAASGADLGVAVDPDVDRLALVADGGVALSEEMTLVLAVDFILGREPGPVAVNLSTTGLIEQAAARHGQPVHRTKVGEANVVATLLGQGCTIGGEGNGGVIYPALHAGRDAVVGIAMILQLLAEQARPLSSIVGDFPPVVMVKDKVAADALPTGPALVAALGALGPGTLDQRDGLKWTGDGAWVHVRPSNTEPVVRIIAEAASAAAARDLIARVSASS